MFRSLMTIIRELYLYLTKVIFMLKHSVKLRRYVNQVKWQHVVERHVCCVQCRVRQRHVCCVLCRVRQRHVCCVLCRVRQRHVCCVQCRVRPICTAYGGITFIRNNGNLNKTTRRHIPENVNLQGVKLSLTNTRSNSIITLHVLYIPVEPGYNDIG